MAIGKDKMRIAQIGPVPPPTGGVAANMIAIHDELLRLGHDSTMIDVTNRSGNSNRRDVIKPRSTAGLLRVLFAGEFDLVHYHIGGRFDSRLAILTLICGLLPGKKSVVSFHSGGFAKESVSNARPFSLRGLAFRSVDLLIGVNDEILEMFKAYGMNGDRTRRILPFELKRPDPNTVIPVELDSAISAFDPLLLSVGALEPEYNNEFLISAMPVVLDRFPKAGLVIVGTGSLEKKLVIPDVLNGRVLLTGDLEHNIVLRLIEKAQVLLRLTDYDGDAISVREALFLGTPVLASDNAMRPDCVHLLTRPFKVSDVVKGVDRAERAQFRGQIGDVQEGRNAEKVVEAYREILGI
jgi:glycosyltransferase involved in cell wall biosynthesis